MNTKLCLLPLLCLGGAALLLAPARTSRAWTPIGGLLDESQRDVRVFDNFLDTFANNNVTAATQFPGQTGAELAIWKGIVEWGSKLHGDGTGDSVGGAGGNPNPLGSGGANFDAFWSGLAGGVGQTNHNIASAIATCGGGGTLAYTELPISDGWRIRICDEWTWDDGPGTISNRWDIQGVMCHEYGHALGLGHSDVSGATMFPSGSPGQTSARSIAADDITGVKAVYGVAAATKPIITATVASAPTLTIHGSNFGATGNEVWFRGPTSATTADPILRVTGVSSAGGGTVIAVTIPATALPGDVMVNKSGAGGATLSNAFPTDLVGTFGTPPATTPDITSVTPASIEALIPGTGETITLGGVNFDLATGVLLDGSPIDAARYTVVNATTLTLDMPQAPGLGAHTLGVTDGSVTDNFAVTIVAPAEPRYELGNGEALNLVDRDNGLTFLVSGTVGSVHRVYISLSNLPSTSGIVSLAIGNQFSQLIDAGNYTIPAAGWLQVDVPPSALADPGAAGLDFYSQTVDLTPPTPYAVSNLQSIHLVQ